MKVSVNVRKTKAWVLVFLLWIVLVGLTITLIFPSFQRFDGNLSVEELSFVTDEKEHQSLLRNVENLQKITIEGQQKLTLFGKFESKEYPEINQTNRLELSLKTEHSHWSLQPITEKSSELELLDLRLTKGTTVNNLRYSVSEFSNRKDYALAVKLWPQGKNRVPDGNSIQLYLGNNPLKLRLSEGFQIKSSNFKKSSEEISNLELTFTPDFPDFKLPLQTDTSLIVNLPQPNEDNNRSWLGGSLKVKNVKFIRVNDSGESLQDNFEESTILKGQIRTAEKELKIQKHQYLTWQPETSGVLSISELHLAFPEASDEEEKQPKETKEPKELEVRFSGEAREISIGLDQAFPIAKIQAGWLSGRLPSDTVTVIISSVTAIVTSLIPWLLDNSLKDKN